VEVDRWVKVGGRLDRNEMEAVLEKIV